MELPDFLVKAKINTYATSGEGGEQLLEDGSKQLRFEENEFKYMDRYFGFNPFIGEEVIWHHDLVIWGMNYYGKIISDSVSPAELYTFLQKAMRLVEKDRPFRGPETLEEGHYRYVDKSNGSIDNFHGTEEIYYRDKKVYELHYQGGMIHARTS